MKVGSAQSLSLSPVTQTFSPRLDVLPPAQRRLWDELGDTPSSFTLYGGTAIALHLGHRQSVDFDFFGTEPFDVDRLLETIPFLAGAEVIQRQANTLTCRVDREGPVLISFFGVPRLGRIAPPLWAHPPGVQVADLLDLAGAKASVVQRRAEPKDYADIDALIGAGVGLPLALSAGGALYGAVFNPQITLKALSYFGDPALHAIPPAMRERLREAARSVDLDALPSLDPRDA